MLRMLERLTQILPRARAAAMYYGRGLVEELEVKPIFLYAQAVAFKVLGSGLRLVKSQVDIL